MEKLIKNKRFLWAAAAVVLFIYNAPSCRTLIPYPGHGQRAPARSSRLQPAAPARAVATAPAAAATAAGKTSAVNPPTISVADAALFANFFGDWLGRSALPRHRMCTLKFELRENHEPERPFAGYSNLVCTPFWPYQPGRARMDSAAILTASQSPMSAILSGTPKNGSIQFHVDKTLGSNCPMTALTLTPFGAKQIAVEWEDTFCGGGQMVLTRTR
jgi:hypothetical protein